MNNFKKDFPLLKKNKIAYLDSGATTQKPKVVIKKVKEFYETLNANPNRGVYKLSEKTTREYENARQVVADFIGAKNSSEIIFTKNATEALNLAASTYGLSHVNAGDKVVISIMEHHSNLVPWQNVAKLKNATLEYMYLKDFVIPDSELEKIDKKTKVVAITMASNVLGTVVNVKKIIEKAHSVGAVVVVDASQAIAHKKVDVTALDADYLAFSGHKIYAPLGIGVLYGKSELLNKTSPFMFGGQMIEFVHEQETTFAPAPKKFEAGTQNIEGAIGLAEALKYVQKIGYSTIEKIEEELTEYALEKLAKLPYVELYVPKNKLERSGVISFNIKGVHSHDVASMLDAQNVCIRSGNHCAQPLMRYLGIDSTARASIAFYNTKEDIDKLIVAIENTYNKFKKYLEK